MGRKDPDRIRPVPTPLTALTLAEVAAAGWIVRASCDRCRVQLVVDVRSMIPALGPDYVLWGRRPRCRVWTQSNDDRRCVGRVSFEAQSIPSGSWRTMDRREVDTALDVRSQLTQRRG